jgi:uncharacterized protein (TIGR03435 family)
MRRLVIGFIIATLPLCSQAPTSAEPSFDVASIKPSAPGTRDSLAIQPGGRFVSNGFSLKALIGLAWRLKGFELSGGDSWTASDRWSIEAKADAVPAVPDWAPPYIPEVIAARLRALLEDRFALRTHRETRTLPVYVLTVGRNGPKHAPDDPSAPPGSLRAGPGAIIGSAVTMDQFVIVLSRLMDRPLIDKTGLKSSYNLSLHFAPESAPRAASGSPESPASEDPSIFTAIQEQLGLKLESTQEPVDVLVIDSAQRPTEN